MVEFTKIAVLVAIRGVLFVFIPKQLQGDMLSLQFLEPVKFLGCLNCLWPAADAQTLDNKGKSIWTSYVNSIQSANKHL